MRHMEDEPIALYQSEFNHLNMITNCLWQFDKFAFGYNATVLNLFPLQSFPTLLCIKNWKNADIIILGIYKCIIWADDELQIHKWLHWSYSSQQLKSNAAINDK